VIVYFSNLRTLSQDRNSNCTCPSPVHPHTLRYGRPRQAPVYLASRTYGHCRKRRTGLHEARFNGCSFLQSTAQLSLQRDRTYNPHPCTVLTAAHNIHTCPSDAPARLSYQRTLMNPYCMFDPADLASERIGALSRSHAAGPASTSLVSDAETCQTRKTLRPLQHPVVAPALTVALVAMTTVDVLGIAAILFHLTILAGLAALSRGTKISLVTSSAFFCSSVYNSA